VLLRLSRVNKVKLQVRDYEDLKDSVEHTDTMQAIRLKPLLRIGASTRSTVVVVPQEVQEEAGTATPTGSSKLAASRASVRARVEELGIVVKECQGDEEKQRNDVHSIHTFSEGLG
jgi:hypothetical protein